MFLPIIDKDEKSHGVYDALRFSSFLTNPSEFVCYLLLPIFFIHV